ncbi:hypothetical protein VSK90_20125 [Bacillus swezeyi]|uniref:hypothetical protein n=1 Tax=Bacillus swezeyi TaxID=1925020 RepID=UPI0039C7397F
MLKRWSDKKWFESVLLDEGGFLAYRQTLGFVVRPAEPVLTSRKERRLICLNPVVITSCESPMLGLPRLQRMFCAGKKKSGPGEVYQSVLHAFWPPLSIYLTD